MGSAKKRTKNYVRPPMQWNTERILEEGALRKEFGLKNAKEVWKAKAELRRIRGNARKLLALGDKGTNATEQILKKVERFGFLKRSEEKENTLDDLLQLDVRNLLDRRLQTRVMKKGLATTAKQARQLITHGFISIDGAKVTIPSYLVPLEEEDKIDYYKKIDITPKVQVEVKEENKKEDKGITRPIPQREERTETPKEEIKETQKVEKKETETPKEEVKETQKEVKKEEKPKEEATKQKESEKKEVEKKGESNE